MCCYGSDKYYRFIALGVPLKDGPVVSSIIDLKNGELQGGGGTFCPNVVQQRSFMGHTLL